jgi:hypothetical protein
MLRVREIPGSNLEQRAAVLTKIFRGLYRSLFEYNLQVGLDRFLPYPLQSSFIYHPFFRRYTV